MKKLVATAPRVAALVEYEDRAILANEVKIRVRFGAPKHGTEVVDFRAASPFIDEDFNGEWQMFTPRPADAPRGIEFGKFQLGNMVVGDIIECGSDVTDYAVGDSVCGYGPLSETVIINAVNNYKLRKLLVNNLEEVKAAIKETGLPVTTACGGYDGWIGDFIEERRLNGLKQIERILEALAEVGGKGIVVPAAWGMFTFRLPPMTSPRSLDGDRKMVSDSLRVLEQVAARTGTVVYLEPLNRYQDHMINTLADARRYIVENDLKHVQIIGDFYHMNIEEDNLAQALHDNRDLLGHVHIADNHRYQPGSGTLDFHALFEQLRADNYQGYVVYEGRIRAEDPAQAYRDSLAWLRTC